MITATYHLVVPFFDVDTYRVVWHGNYPKYLELARCKLLDELDYNYSQMEASGFFFPIVDMAIKYVKPIVFEQAIVIEATLSEWENRLKIIYIIRDSTSGTKLTKAHTTQAAVEMPTKTLCLQSPKALLQKVAAWQKAAL